MQKWKSKLTSLERKHINYCGIKSKKGLAEIFKYQRVLRSKNLKQDEPCFVCKRMAIKLGYPI